ncbi:MAG TPA: tetratricopeptide repeat protein, partial [Gemmatimonadaceae bacterium]
QADERRAFTLRRMRERARMELGQPARVSLDALHGLDREAERLGLYRERVAVLMMASQTHGRLGDQRTAERIALECVEMAKAIDDRPLLADALNRLGNTVAAEVPSRARHAFADALEISESIGDVRGQARGLNHLGIVALFEARLNDAEEAFSRALVVARGAGIPDLWGLAAQNLGVLLQKCGDYNRARELFGDALALFAAVKHSEYQLVSLYNLAHVERELGLWQSAGELYDATMPLAQRIGQSDIEIGATAGAGLCYLELGKIDAARKALADVNRRMETRPDWFQGREVAEALNIRVDAFDEKFDEALSRFDRALRLAESSDLYNTAWLTVTCAETLARFAPEQVAMSIERYRERIKGLGYPEMTRRYETLLKR